MSFRRGRRAPLLLLLLLLPLAASACPAPGNREPVVPSAGGSEEAGTSSGLASDAGPGEEPPFQITEAPVVAIDAGELHTCALTADGLVFCWGVRECGSQVTSNDIMVPMASGAATAIGVGGDLDCVVEDDGGVGCWGTMPGAVRACQEFEIPAPLDFAAVAVAVGNGRDHPPVCVETTDGVVWCFEAAALYPPPVSCGQKKAKVGPNICDSAPLAPQVVPHVGPLHGVAVDEELGCGITATGTVLCWPLGNDDGTWRVLPAGDFQAAGVVVEVEPIGDGLCVITESGEVRCRAHTGAITAADGGTFLPVAGIEGPATGMDAAHGEACVVAAGGRVFCWDTRTADAQAHEVQGLDGRAAAVTVGGMHACALLDDGTVRCWGDNSRGQLGRSEPAQSDVAVPVAGLGPPR